MLLNIVKMKYSFTVHAYCVMKNHFHIEITTKDVPVWKIMRLFLTCYAVNINHKYGNVGHLFNARYHSELIRSDMDCLSVSRRIHCIPVVALGLRNPLDYQYSSYNDYVKEKPEDTGMVRVVDTSRVLSCFRVNPREEYKMFVEKGYNYLKDCLIG